MTKSGEGYTVVSGHVSLMRGVVRDGRKMSPLHSHVTFTTVLLLDTQNC